MKLKFEKFGKWSTDTVESDYLVKIIPQDTNLGDSELIHLEDDLLTDIVCMVGMTWNTDAITDNGYVVCEFDKLFFDEEGDFTDVIEEMTEEYEVVYKQQIARNFGCYIKYYEALSDYLMDIGDMKFFDEPYKRDAASTFEDSIAEMDWEDLTNLSEEMVVSMVKEDIGIVEL